MNEQRDKARDSINNHQVTFMKIYGSGFEKIKYKGKPVLPEVNDSVGVAYYQHIYSSNFSGTRKHMCLQYGDWCWRQVLRRPDEAFKYLLSRKK